MSSTKFRIVFFGTPDFAMSSLKILVENGYNIVGVVTAPDRPKGRGQKISVSEVKKYALEQNLNILQPTNLKSTAFIEELRNLNANLQIIVAFRMLPEVVWNMPNFGTFNLHASLLPKYRGAAPINWAIINGEKETGVTTFFLKHEIDTGDIILQDSEMINPEDTAGDLYIRLMNKGAELVLKTVRLLEDGKYELSNQIKTASLPTAPKIFKSTCEINWNQATDKVFDFIRGLSPYPTAWTRLGDKTYKIYIVQKREEPVNPGEVKINNNNLLIGTKDGSLLIEEFQPEGKKRMSPTDYLRGNTI